MTKNVATHSGRRAANSSNREVGIDEGPSRTEPERLLVRPAKVAELLDVSRSSVYELIAAGVIPSIKLGKSIRVPLDKLKAFLDSR
jgi:excisionase family DNA binding protein